MVYYLDSCIWLNLFLKEGDMTKGKPYWKIAEEFIVRNPDIIFSTINLKEIGQKVEETTVVDFLENLAIRPFKTENEDYILARRFEKEYYELSFYDYLHVAIALRRKAILITRDRDLLAFAGRFITAFKPEDLL